MIGGPIIGRPQQVGRIAISAMAISIGPHGANVSIHPYCSKSYPRKEIG